MYGSPGANINVSVDVIDDMAILEHPQTGERIELEGELPFGATYMVEGYDEENDELWEEARIDLDGVSYIVIDDGVEMFETGSSKE